jgi:ribonucleotide reductase alpha subunit
MSVLTDHIRNKYKTVWEIPMKHLIDMAADRGAFICQSQSLNLWLEEPNYNTLTSMHFYSWTRGLKTGIYYLRRKAKHQAQQFTIEPESVSKESKEGKEKNEGDGENISFNKYNIGSENGSDENACMMCSS